MVKNCIQLFTGAVFLVFFLGTTAAADVSVYAEGAYTDTDLVVYIYADVPVGESPLVSYGIMLIYNPDELVYDPENGVIPVVTKNDAVWYFGSPPPGNLATPNADPDLSTPGAIIIVGGKIDETNPTEGVSGNRQLIAHVSFAINVDSFTPSPSTPPDIGLYVGRDGTYVNFVRVAGTPLDDNGNALPGLNIGATEIHRRGDANGDGKVSMLDMSIVKSLVLNAQYVCYADANGDGKVSMLDMGTIKNIVLGIQ